jgi:hypothetical protein
MIKLAQIVKKIKGHEYIYEVTWDQEKKKQVWTYRGKVSKDFNLETFKDEIYNAVRKNYRIRIPKNDLKQLRKVIAVVVDKYKQHW